MKKILIPFLLVVIAGSLAVSVVMLKRGSHRMKSETEAVTVSDGDHTWKVGAVTLDGTNVPLDEVQVRAQSAQ